MLSICILFWYSSKEETTKTNMHSIEIFGEFLSKIHLYSQMKSNICWRSNLRPFFSLKRPYTDDLSVQPADYITIAAA